MALTGAQQERIAFKATAKAQFRSLTKEVAAAIRRSNAAAILKGTELIAERARQIVPVDSGRLRDSIRGRTRKARGEDRVIGSISTNTKGAPKYKRDFDYKAKGKKKSDVVKVGYGYGLDVEIGRPSGNYHSTPYLRPALAQTKDQVLKVLKEEVKQEAAKQPGKRGRPKK